MRHLSVFLCLKYLQKRKIVLLSIAAVAMSSALLITIASLFTGFINAVESGAGEHMGDIMIVAPPGLRIQEYDALIRQLEADDAIVGATAVLGSQGLLLLGHGDVRAVRIWGIELPGRDKVTPIGQFLLRPTEDGGAPTFAMEDGVEEGGFVGIGVLGDPDEITDEYDFEGLQESFVGRRVLLTTGTVVDADRAGGLETVSEGSGRPGRFRRRTIRFRIANVVFSGMHEFDKNFVYLPIAMVSEQLYPGQGKVAEMIQIRLRKGADSMAEIDRVRAIWSDFAEERFKWADYATIESSRQMQAQLIAEYRKQMGILMLIFGVVSFGVVLLIFCIFYLIVMTRRKDIAIVKSCGMGSGAVASMFMSFGLAVGLTGSVLGVGLGYVFTRYVNTIEHGISVVFGLKLWKSSTYMFSRIPSEMDWSSAGWVAAAAVLAAGAGALIPAITAARVRPVRLLRYE